MKYKNKLISILLFKNRMSNWPKIYTEEDLKEIDSWSELKCKKVYKRIISYIYKYSFPGMATTCPWCQRYFFTIYLKKIRCIGCGYGKRHGKCYLNTSFFYKNIGNFYSAHKRLYTDIQGGKFDG